MQFFRSIATVGSWTMSSRILGFVRDVMIAQILGAGFITDAFFIAFKFPNLFRRLFGEGAMNAAFVPLYAGRLEAEGPESARRFASEAGAVLIAGCIILSLIAMACMPWIMMLQAAGFVDEPAKFDLTVELARITFPYLMFMVLTAMLSGMLNSVGRFAAAAAAPVVLNIVVITALLVIKYHDSVFPDAQLLPGHSLALAVSVAGAFQFLLLVRACAKAGIIMPIGWPRMTPGVKRLLVLMAPGVVGAGVVQINVMVGDLLATLLAEGSVSFLYYADRVNQLPLGVIGVAVGIALLPLMTRQLRAGNDAEAMHSLNRAIEICLVLTVPAAVALIIIPYPIVTVLFERGAFTSDAAIATAAALQAFAFGLPAYVLVKSLLPGFFAREDTATPVKIAAASMLLNILLAIGLMQVYAHVGIAMAAALSAWIHVAGLAAVLWRRGHLQLDARLKRHIPRLALALIPFAGGLWFLSDFLNSWLEGSAALRMSALAIMVAGGGVLFFISATITGAANLAEAARMLRRTPAKQDTETT